MRITTLAPCALLSSASAMAAEPLPAWQLSVGAALRAAPLFSGAADGGLAVLPDVRLRYGEHFFASLAEGVGYAYPLAPGWRAAVLLKWRFPRREDPGTSPFLLAGDSTALHGMGDVAGAWEPGAWLEYATPNWRVRLEARRGFVGHEGGIVEVDAAWHQRWQGLEVSGGPRLVAASAAFVHTYYGVDVKQAQRSGLSPYAPTDGLVSAGWSLSLRQALDAHWQWSANLTYDYLWGDAADSPLLRERGSRHQPALTLGLGYRF